MEMNGQIHAPRKDFLVANGYEAGWIPEPVCSQWQREKKVPVFARN
jgi:hypothetical protein